MNRILIAYVSHSGSTQEIAAFLEKHLSDENLTVAIQPIRLQAALPTIEKIQPVSLAFLAGKLDLRTLPLPEKLIMVLLMLLTGKRPGDYRNWATICAWVDGLHKEMQWIPKV